MIKRKYMALMVSSMVLICIFSIVAIATFLYDTKEADHHLQFNSDGAQGNHYWIVRENKSNPGYMNVTHDYNSTNVQITFENIESIAIDLTSLCSDEANDKLFLATGLGSDYCYQYLPNNNYGITLISSDPINISFYNVPEPLMIYLNDSLTTEGSYDVDRYDGDWTYDDGNEILYTQIGSGTHDIELYYYQPPITIGTVLNIVVELAPVIAIVYVTRTMLSVFKGITPRRRL